MDSTVPGHGMAVKLLKFKSYFRVVRDAEAKKRFWEQEQVIRQGDFLHCDVGIKYLRLYSDHQQWAYVLKKEKRKRRKALGHSWLWPINSRINYRNRAEIVK